jgi:hypothetical protein
MSTQGQLRGDSLRRQVERSRAYAAEHGLDLDETTGFNDIGVSAFRGENLKHGALPRSRCRTARLSQWTKTHRTSSKLIGVSLKLD